MARLLIHPLTFSAVGQASPAFEMTLLAAFSAVLARYCAESSFCLGVAAFDDDEQGYVRQVFAVQAEPEASNAHFVARVREAYGELESLERMPESRADRRAT